MLAVQESLLMQNFYQIMTTNFNIISIQCILCNVNLMCSIYMYVCFMCTSMETNRVRDSEHPNQEEWKIRRQQQSIASCIHAAPTSKQLLPPETTANLTNSRNAEEEAETNQQALTITLTRDTR